jgi:iron(III) transport system substrate-binding protein
MSRVRAGVLGAVAIFALGPSAALAQSGDGAWTATIQKAKEQTLVLVYSDNKAFDTIVEEFTKKYGVKVQSTVARPTVILPRVKTEQTNGQYLWDVWWSITANMVNVAAPSGMLQPFEPFLMLPEVKDIDQWRHKDYIYGEAGRFVFTYSHEVSFSVYHNSDVVPEVKLDTIDALLDPRLKGKIVARDASQPNSGAFALSPIYKAKGGEFLTKFLKDQEPKILENPQQLDTSLMRGGSAVAVGMQNTSYATCLKDGGCKNIAPMPELGITLSRGLSVFKNAPHPEAAKVFINWLLSREGQAVAVREWAKYNLTGAVSMRKDVEPHPDHKLDQPDFSNPGQYVWVSTDDGSKEIDAVVKIFKDVTGK